MRRGAVLAVGAVLGVVVAGCTQDVDPAWQLDHDRVIAVRVAPPRIASGETAEVDALIGRKGQAPSLVEPATAEVESPTSLADTLVRRSHWTVTAPDESRLAAARTELGLEAGAAVPLRLRVTFTDPGDPDLVALKVVWLGQHSDNPVIDPVMVNGMNALGQSQLAVPAGVDIPLEVNFDTSFNINWLTSCGTMHDFDLARAHLRVEPDDPQAGSFAIVVHDTLGGVDWHLWPITAQ